AVRPGGIVPGRREGVVRLGRGVLRSSDGLLPFGDRLFRRVEELFGCKEALAGRLGGILSAGRRNDGIDRWLGRLPSLSGHFLRGLPFGGRPYDLPIFVTHDRLPQIERKLTDFPDEGAWSVQLSGFAGCRMPERPHGGVQRKSSSNSI